MTIFDIVNDICNSKTHRLDNDVSWDDAAVSPYMLQRWVSMTSPLNAYLINELANRVGTDPTSDEKLCYHLLSSIAQPNRRKIRYAKRQKLHKEQPNKELEAEAAELWISKDKRRQYDFLLEKLRSLSNETVAK